jgi:pimeloyl-ACP methyl ester carboxylesterase
MVAPGYGRRWIGVASAGVILAGLGTFATGLPAGAGVQRMATTHFRSEVGAQEPRKTLRIVRSAYEIAPVLEQAWKSFARPEESLWEVLPGIRCPLLLAWARNDAVISLTSAKPAFARFPNHHLEVFAGGHAAFLEDPERFEKTLRRFLGTVYS